MEVIFQIIEGLTWDSLGTVQAIGLRHMDPRRKAWPLTPFALEGRARVREGGGKVGL